MATRGGKVSNKAVKQSVEQSIGTLGHLLAQHAKQLEGALRALESTNRMVVLMFYYLLKKKDNLTDEDILALQNEIAADVGKKTEEAKARWFESRKATLPPEAKLCLNCGNYAARTFDGPCRCGSTEWFANDLEKAEEEEAA